MYMYPIVEVGQCTFVEFDYMYSYNSNYNSSSKLSHIYSNAFVDGLKRLDYRTQQWDRRLSKFMVEQRDKNPSRIAILTGKKDFKPSISSSNHDLDVCCCDVTKSQEI